MNNPRTYHMHRIPRRAGMAGFTLIEAMVVVAIAAILATMAVPSYTSFVAGQRVNAVKDDLVIAMMKARNEAVMRNASVTVTANSGGWQNGWQMTDSTSAVLESYGAVPLSVAISAVFSGSGSSVIYQSSGRLHPSLTGQVAFAITSSTSTSAFQCVTTDLSGRPNSKTTTPCP